MEMSDEMKAGNGRHDTCWITEREVSKKVEEKEQTKKTHTTQDIRSEVGMDKETTDKTSRKPKQSTD